MRSCAPILRRDEAILHRTEQVGRQRLGLGPGGVERDQRKTWQ